MLLDAVAIQGILPHRYPFLFLDAVQEIETATEGGDPRIVATKCVSIADPILQGHFPGNPLLPGVVQVEAMAQAAVVLAHAVGKFDPAVNDCLFIGIQEAKFRAPVRPGETLSIEVKATRLGRIGRFEGTIRCGDAVKSSAKFTALVEKKQAPAKPKPAAGEADGDSNA